MNRRHLIGWIGLLLAAAALRAAPPSVDSGYLVLGFDQLASYKFVAPAFDPVADPQGTPPTGEEQIPAAVKDWNGRKAVIRGFMLPTRMENGRTTEFLLMANQMTCCFGLVPDMNDWVVVRMPQGTPVIQDVPITFYGTLHVGAMFENGYMTGIYAMDAERMGPAPQ
jgi:hypothetical protein